MTTGYHVECDSDGCERCRQGASFVIIDPFGIAGGTSWMDKSEAEDHCYELNEAYKKGTLARASLADLIKAYNRYRDMDSWIMDSFFLIPDAGVNRQDRLIIRTLWEAVKAAVEGEGK